MINLRTEIVLNDARDVAFWFSYSFRFVTSWQHTLDRRGKRLVRQSHQTRATPSLFPVRVLTEKRIIPGEDARK